MRRLPRPPDEPIISRFILWRIAFVAMLAVAGTFALFVWELNQGESIETARTVAVNTLVVFEAFYLINTRFFYDSVLSRKGLSGNRYIPLAIGILITLQALFTYTDVMNTLFETTSIHGWAWVRIIGVGALIFFLVELEKYVLRANIRWRMEGLKY